MMYSREKLKLAQRILALPGVRQEMVMLLAQECRDDPEVKQFLSDVGYTLVDIVAWVDSPAEIKPLEFDVEGT